MCGDVSPGFAPTTAPKSLSAMMRAPARWLGAATLATVAVSGCSSAPRAVQTGPQPAAAPPVTQTQGDQAAFARAKADSAIHPYTEADIRFMSGMIGHHAQAIVMARWAPTHGASPSVRTLCERIINAQQDEIATMQTWLRDRQLPVPEATAAGMKMMMNGQEQMMLMPGMLSAEQMKRLDEARGPEFDRLFLGFMIQHHRGAVTMVDELFHSYGAAEDDTVFKFASDVNIDQTTEIARMEQMLFTLSGQASAP
jgi:uncharacterized protein (DUF305 family)